MKVYIDILPVSFWNLSTGFCCVWQDQHDLMAVFAAETILLAPEWLGALQRHIYVALKCIFIVILMNLMFFYGNVAR